MMKTQALLLAGALVLAPGAWASNCPNLMQEIDAMLEATPSLDEETIVDEEMRKSVKELRAEGEELHKQGKHAESVEALERALELLKEEAG